MAGCPRWDARWAQQSGRLASPRRREDLGTPRSATPRSRGCCGWSESSAASRRSAGLSKPRHKTRVRPRAALSHESQANNHLAQRSPAGRVALPAPSPGRPAPRGRGGQAGRRDGSPVSHPHLSHAHTCSRARPLSRQCLLVAPAHSAGRNALPGMPFTPWLPLLLLHRRRKVTPDGREQMVPCHKCHPGTIAWAALARRPDLTVGKAVLPGFSRPDPSFPPPLPAIPLACPAPGGRWPPAPLMAQTKGWVVAHPLWRSSRSRSARRGSDWAEMSPWCPEQDGARAGQAARSCLGAAGQGELARAGRCGRAGWHVSPLPTPAPGGALLESHATTHPGGCCSPPQR